MHTEPSSAHASRADKSLVSNPPARSDVSNKAQLCTVIIFASSVDIGYAVSAIYSNADALATNSTPTITSCDVL